MKLNENESLTIYYSKAIAIFCVICAHSTPVLDEVSKLTEISSQLLNYLGTMGVPVFFLLSGYLFEKNTKRISDFWRTKLRTIIIPWLFCETILWLYVVLRSKEISFKSWLLFIIGYKHTTYYITVLLVFYLLFYWLKSDKIMIIAIILSIVSIISLGWGCGINFINNYTGTYYLNPLNWMMFFCGGILISRHSSLWKVTEKVRIVAPLLAIISFAYFIINLLLKESIYYFSKYSLVSLVTNTLLIIYIGYSIARIRNKSNESRICNYLKVIGVYSYSIYLLHQFFAGIIVRITNFLDFFILVLLRPWVVILVTSFVISVFANEKIFKGRFGNIIRGLLGIRL